MEQKPDDKEAARQIADATKRMSELVDSAYERFMDMSNFDFRDYLTDEELAEYERLERVSDELGKVVIEVLGGVAEVTSNPLDIQVKIIDHDNLKAEGKE